MKGHRKPRVYDSWTIWYVLGIVLFLSSLFCPLPLWLLWPVLAVFMLGGVALLIESYKD